MKAGPTTTWRATSGSGRCSEAVIETDLGRAAAMIDLGRFADAVRMLGPLVAAEPDSRRAWCLLSRAQLGAGDSAAAVAAAHRASALDPADDWPYRLASTALIGLKRPEDAVRAAMQARDLAPHFWRSHVCLAQAAAAAGQQEVAGAACAEAMALAPDEPDVQVTAGKVALGNGDLAVARARQHAALAIDPGNLGALNELGLVCLRAGDPAGAAGYFLSAVRAAPGIKVFGQNTEVALTKVALSAAAWIVVLAPLLACTGVLAATAGAGPAVAAVVIAVALGLRPVRMLRRLPPQARHQLARLLWNHRAEVALGVLAAAASRVHAGPRVRPRTPGRLVRRRDCRQAGCGDVRGSSSSR
jgi:Flp pilus assembly protein TadD